MTCGKSQRELWVEHKRIVLHLKDFPEDRDRMVARGHAARAAWKAHLSEPIVVMLSKNHSGGFGVYVPASWPGFYRVNGDIRSETTLSATAAQIWSGERPRRADDPDAEDACDLAKVERLPRLIDELRR